MVEVDAKLEVAHFLLGFPYLKSTVLYTLYKIAQTGTYLQNDMCTYFDTNKYVVNEDLNTTLVPLDIENCERHWSFYACTESAFPNEVSCIQKDNLNCPLSVYKCTSSYTFVETIHGILLRNNRMYTV